MAKEMEASIGLTTEQLKEIIKAARSPIVDPVAEARKLENQKRFRAQEKAALESQEAAWRACPHLREDQSSTIFWAENSDGMVRGTCCRCQRKFVPEDADYPKWIGVPTYRGR